MLEIIGGPVIPRNDYSIVHKSNGLDEVHLQISLADRQIYPLLLEGKTRLIERTEAQTYLVQKVNGAGNYADITCRLDLTDWQKDLLIDLSDLSKPGWAHSLRETDMLARILSTAAGLSGWRMVNRVKSHQTRQMEMDGPTPLEAALQLQKTFGCALRFDTREKTVTILYPAELELSDGYAVESVNLRTLPNYKGYASELCTRLYPVGYNGLGIAAVNNGVPYVQNTDYTRDIISQLWRDIRFSDAASLKEAAIARLERLSSPVQSWQLDIVDLHRIDPLKWPGLSLDIWTKIMLVDNSRDTRRQVIVAADKVFPYYPEKNKITVTTVESCSADMKTLQQSAITVEKSLADPNSDLWSRINATSRS